MLLRKDEPPRVTRNNLYKKYDLVELPNSFTIGFGVHPEDSHGDRLLLNTSNPLIQWLVRVQRASANGSHGITHQQYATLEGILCDACSEPWDLEGAEVYINKWREIRDLPSELYPPKVALHADMFLRIPRRVRGSSS
jgi:hypothetical protein